MLTVYYVAATWLQSWRLNSTLVKIRNVRQKNGSIAIHQELPPYIYMTGSGHQQKLEIDSVLSKQCSNYSKANVGDLLWFGHNKRMVSLYPQQLLDISDWIAVIPGRTHLPFQIKGTKLSLVKENKLYLLLEADYNTCRYQGYHAVIEIENYGIPVAWHARENLCLLLESDEASLAALGVAFQHNVTLENGIQIIRIQSVSITGHPYKIQNVGSVPESYAPLEPGLDRAQMKECFMSRWRAHVSMLCTFCDAVQQVKDSFQDISVRHPGSGVGAVKLVPSLSESEDLDLVDSPGKTSIEDILTTDSSIVTSALVEPSTPSSGVSISRMSTDTLLAPGSTKLADSLTTSMYSLRSLPTTPRKTIDTSSATGPVKPPNIVVFSDSTSAADSVKAALEATLCKDRYTIHTLSCAELVSSVWFNQATLIVLHGNVPPECTPVIIDYLLSTSGSVLCLCSDLLGFILPVFHTAEVRPNELVHCSYKTWKHVPLMHHVFCYQPSPNPATQFSHDDHNSLSAIPASVELKDKNGKVYKLKVEVLGAEETWQTPSLLLVSGCSSAKIVFSQVHLEAEPSQFESDEKRRTALEKSDRARLEILCDVLSNHLGIHCSLNQNNVAYTPAYFLGNHEVKLKLLENLQKSGHLDSNNTLQSGDVALKFCGKGVTPPTASSTLLPVLLHSCPETFSTVTYFENLKTEDIGRLVIYSEVMSSSMAILRGPPLHHGFTTIPNYQTQGIGRGGNAWLSPEGCAMFTVQLHIPLDSFIGQHLSILQNLCAAAIVSAICQIPGLEDLDVGIKWPNDIYANKTSKIGGITVASTVTSEKAICNIGCGVNLNNKEPTLCLNDMIKTLNKQTGRNITSLPNEKYFAIVFNKMEEIYNLAQSGNIDETLCLYYNYWLHSNAEIEVQSADGVSILVKVKGIDAFGFLLVETVDGKEISVQPDGNTFDMMAGLILPKVQQ